MGLRVSVLIPTLGRERELINTVEALMAQTRVPDEIIVVDQNVPPFPRVNEVLGRISRVKHIRSEIPGVCWNLNIGLRHATGDIVLFLDDDVELDRQLIEGHLRNYEAADGESIVGIAGRVEQPMGDRDPEEIGGNELGRYHPWKGSISAHFNARKRAEVLIAPGGNMSFRRQALWESGGVDLGFEGNGYYWETDLSLRVGQRGGKIIFDPRAQLRHLMAPAGGCRITDKSVHTYYFVKNGLRLARRHSPGAALFLIVPRLKAYVLAKAAYNRDLMIFLRGCRGIWEGLFTRSVFSSNLREDSKGGADGG